MRDQVRQIRHKGLTAGAGGKGHWDMETEPKEDRTRKLEEEEHHMGTGRA